MNMYRTMERQRVFILLAAAPKRVYGRGTAIRLTSGVTYSRLNNSNQLSGTSVPVRYKKDSRSPPARKVVPRHATHRKGSLRLANRENRPHVNVYRRTRTRGLPHLR